jgi:hypothetical protein
VGLGCLKITRPGVSQHLAQITQGRDLVSTTMLLDISNYERKNTKSSIIQPRSCHEIAGHH